MDISICFILYPITGNKYVWERIRQYWLHWVNLPRLVVSFVHRTLTMHSYFMFSFQVNSLHIFCCVMFEKNIVVFLLPFIPNFIGENLLLLVWETLKCVRRPFFTPANESCEWRSPKVHTPLRIYVCMYEVLRVYIIN